MLSMSSSSIVMACDGFHYWTAGTEWYLGVGVRRDDLVPYIALKSTARKRSGKLLTRKLSDARDWISDRTLIHATYV